MVLGEEVAGSLSFEIWSSSLLVGDRQYGDRKKEKRKKQRTGKSAPRRRMQSIRAFVMGYI